VVGVRTGPEYAARNDLLAIFDYYDRHGLVGNPRALAALLGRSPTTFAAALARK